MQRSGAPARGGRKKAQRNRPSVVKLDEPIVIGVCAMEKKARQPCVARSQHVPPTVCLRRLSIISCRRLAVAACARVACSKTHSAAARGSVARRAAYASAHRVAGALLLTQKPLPQTSSKAMQAILTRLTSFSPGEFKVRARRMT